MEYVNYFPKIGEERELPFHVIAIGIGHEQEPVNRFDKKNPTHFRLHLTIRGCGIVTINNTRHLLPVGSILYTPPYCGLNFEPSPKGWTDHWIRMSARDESAPPLSWLGGEPRILHLRSMSVIREVFESINRDLTSHTRSGRLRASAGAYQLIMETIIESDEKFNENPSVSRIISDATDYIEQHFREQIALDEIRAVCNGVSGQYLCRVFRNHIGMRPVEYILHRRITHAKHLLAHTNLSIYEIAAQSGFMNESYFYRKWKDFESMTPSEYRCTHSGIFK